MKKEFSTLTRSDVEYLRRKSVAVDDPRNGVIYNFTVRDLNDAVRHLETIYSGTVRASFAAKILLANEIY